MEFKVIISLCLMCVVAAYAAPSGGNPPPRLMAEKTGCDVLKSGRIVCVKDLKGDCEGHHGPPASGEDADDDDDSAADDDDDVSPTNSTGVTEGPKSGEDDKDKCKQTSPLEITLSSIQEQNNGTNLVPAETAPKKHGYASFLPDQFTIGQIEDAAKIPNSGDTAAKKVSSSAMLTNGATVTLDVYIVTASGKLDMSGEKTDIKKGMMKFSIGVTNWTWCGGADSTMKEDCGTDIVGDSLEVRMQIKFRAEDLTVKDRKIDLGSNAFIQFSEQVKLDDAWAAMSVSPVVEKVGEDHFLVLKFNRFASTLEYDPVADLGDYGHGENSPTSGATTASVTSAFACMLMLLSGMFVL